jgi:hypothetical protein
LLYIGGCELRVKPGVCRSEMWALVHLYFLPILYNPLRGGYLSAKGTVHCTVQLLSFEHKPEFYVFKKCIYFLSQSL